MATIGSVLNKSTNKLRRLIQQDIRDKNLIKSGDLIKSIDASFKEERGKITLSIGAIYYYTFLDDGTRYIKARNITNDVMESREFKILLEETTAGVAQVMVDKLFN